MRKTPRMRRLNSDRRRLEQLAEQSTIFEFECFGDPAEIVRVTIFWKRALARSASSGREGTQCSRSSCELVRLVSASDARAALADADLSSQRLGRRCRLFGGYGTYWVPSLMLDELCEMLWDMIRYQNFDVDSPYNRDAAAWTKTQKTLTLPLDRRPIRDKVADGIVDVRNDIQPRQPTFADLPEVSKVEVDIRHVDLIAPTVIPDILFLDEESDVITAEIVQDNESDILVIE